MLIAKEQPVIISVPLHAKKWGIRGYNQAHLLAHTFSQLINYPYEPNLIFRTKKTDDQVGKSGTERRKNLHGAFAINTSIAIPEKVLIIDDVVTTGTTCNELSELLKRAGVKEVIVLSICISLPKV